MEHGNDGGPRQRTPAVAGGLARHIPVLGRRAVELLAVRDGGVYVDATFGAGGHTRAILAAANCARHRHRPRPAARSRSAPTWCRRPAAGLSWSRTASPISTRWRAGCGHDAVDGVVFDLGVSSMQLDEAARGFSFRHDGPLDMRMGGGGASAADVVARRLRARARGHHRDARRRAPCARRRARDRRRPPRRRRSRTTRALAEIVARVVRARPGAIHPATRTFQALRIFVNEELAELAAGTEPRPSGCSSRAGGWWWSHSIRSKTAS